ncbi:MAG TPA: ABC transporter permease, partial [Thermoanaerobaculia bacterium]|nr:ABC transporter permease [Thermoanaerobaculia bacterium]
MPGSSSPGERFRFWRSGTGADLRHAVRSLVRTPAFTLAAVLTMALGVGVNSVIFSAVHGVLLRPLAYPRPAELVDVRETSGRAGTSITAGSGSSVSAASLMDYRRESRSFSGMAAYALQPMNMTGGELPRRVWAERITANFFDVLEVAPAKGRYLRAGEDAFGARRLAILGDELWHELGADPNVVGRPLRLDDQTYEVIGVAPAGFAAPNAETLGEPIAVYVPTAFTPDLLSAEGHGDHELDVIGRLAPGAGIDTAQRELTRISRSLEARYPGTNLGVRAVIRPLHEAIVGEVRTPLLVLLAAVGLVWLVACVNLANLMLVRAVARQRETTVRIALGASRGRVMRALITHSVVIAIAGCACGLVLGVALQALLLRFAPPDIPRLDAIAFDAPVFVVTSLLSLLAGIAFGIVPAWRASLTQPAQSLRASERGLSSAAVLRWQRALVVAEIALSFVLLAGSGLLLRSLATVMGVDLGFRTDHVLAALVTLPDGRYPDAEARLRFFTALEERLRGMPGVAGVAFANRLPMRGGWTSGINTDASAADATGDSIDTDMQAVNPGYFDVFGIRLLRGRGLTAGDRQGTPSVAVVNEALVRRFFPGTEPLGHRFRRGTAPWITIVGVVADIRRGGKTAAMVPEAYLPATQTGLYPMHLADLAVRTTGDPLALVPVVRSAVLAVDPDQPVANVRTMDEVVSRSLAMRRFEALLLAIFAATAVALAVVGIYGVASYSVSQRAREFGLRTALGARAGQVLRMVLGQAAVLVATGLAIGLLGALWLSQYLQALLFGVAPTDVPTLTGVALALAAVAALACVVPARRAA